MTHGNKNISHDGLFFLFLRLPVEMHEGPMLRGCVSGNPPNKHDLYTGWSPRVLRYGRCKSKPSPTELGVELPAQEVNVREEVAQGGRSPPRLWWGKDTFEQNAGGHGPLLTCTTNSNMKLPLYFFFTYVPSWSFCSYQ